MTLVLQQRDIESGAQDLPDGENQIDTGYMGACISVIVMWDLAGTRYRRVRGFHGSGGWEAINFKSLFAGIPADQALIFVIAPKETWTVYNQKRFSETFQNVMQKAAKRAIISPRAILNRQGEIVEMG